MENDVRSNIDEIIHASKQAHEGGNGTKFEFTVNFEDGSFDKIEEIKIGDELGEDQGSIISYKLSNKGKNYMIIENPNVPLTSIRNGPVTDIKINTEEKLIAEHIQIGPHSFVVIRRPEEKIQWRYFDLDFGGLQPDLAVENEDILFSVKNKVSDGPDEATISIIIHNFGDMDAEPFNVDIQIDDNTISTLRIEGIQAGKESIIELEQNLDSGNIISVFLDVDNEINETSKDNNKAQRLYENLPLIYISGSNSIGGTRGDLDDFFAQGKDSIIVEYLLQEEVQKSYMQGYNEAETEEEADIVVLVGGPLANVPWSKKLNEHTKTAQDYDWYWDYDKGELHVHDHIGTRGSSAVVGTGIIENTDTEYDERNFIWIYGTWFTGTVAATRMFINYAAEVFLPKANDGEPYADFIENAFLDDELENGNFECGQKWEYYENNPTKMDELRDDTFYYLSYNLGDTDNDEILDEVEEEKDIAPFLWDSDNDGMADGWEDLHEFDPSTPNNKDDDSDWDGYDANHKGGIDIAERFTDLEEFWAGTDPNDKDSDDDNIIDGWEYIYKLNPTDSTDALENAETNDLTPEQLSKFRDINLDDDGMNNLREYLIGKNPNELDIIGFFLVISFDWDIKEDYLRDFINGLHEASKYLYDGTEGHMVFSRIEVHENSNNWNSADIRIHDSTTIWPHVDWDGIGGITKSNKPIYLPHHFDGSNVEWDDSWMEINGFRTIIHEFGHYAFFLYDEYINNNDDTYRPDDNNNFIGDGRNWPTWGEGVGSIMNYQYDLNDPNLDVTYFSSPGSYSNYNPNYDDSDSDSTDDDLDTKQYLNREWGKTTDESCWDTIFRKYHTEWEILNFDFDNDGIHEESVPSTPMDIEAPPLGHFIPIFDFSGITNSRNNGVLFEIDTIGGGHYKSEDIIDDIDIIVKNIGIDKAAITLGVSFINNGNSISGASLSPKETTLLPGESQTFEIYKKVNSIEFSKNMDYSLTVNCWWDPYNGNNYYFDNLLYSNNIIYIQP